MPENIKEALFDCYRLPNNSVLNIFVQDERQPILDWFVNNGANIDEEVTILYHWGNETSEFAVIEDGDEDNSSPEDEYVIKEPKKFETVSVDDFDQIESDF